MSLIAVIVLPCFLIGWLFSVAIRRAHRSNPPIRPLLLYPLVCSLILTSGFMIWGYHATLTSKSSTAAIGFFFVPFYSAALAVITFVVSWAILYVGWFIYQKIQGTPLRPASVALLVLAVALLAWSGYVGYGKIARHRLLNEAASGYNVDRLQAILADGISSHDIELLAMLAKNKNTSCDDFARLYDFCKPSIGKIGRSESKILHELAKNPQTPPHILGLLANSEHSWMRSSVAANPNTSIGTLRQLSEDKESFVRNYAKGRLRSREQEEKQRK